MTLNEITAAIEAMPIDSHAVVYMVDVFKVDIETIIIDHSFYSTAADAAAAVQELA